MMHVRHPFWLLLIGAGLAACAGGSGSSGFDITPQSENAAIMLALSEQQCIERHMLTICPADATPAPGAGQIDTGLNESGAVPCAPAPDAAGCGFIVPFVPTGFPPTATFRVATRDVSQGGDWRLSAAPVSSGTPSAPDFEVPVSVPAPTDTTGGGEQVQLAVLVFLQPPAALPAAVAELADTGADFAFVTHDLQLQSAGG